MGAGDHKFNATVASNDNYIGATSDDEPFHVNKAQLVITTKVHNASHTDITGTDVQLGTIAHDTATVTGGVAGFALPATSFQFDSAAIANDGKPAAADSGFTAVSVPTSALGAGDHGSTRRSLATSNYIGATSGDEPFPCSKAAAHDRNEDP